MTAVDLTEHRVTPLGEEPGIRTCQLCGMAWPCPERLARVRAESDELLDRRVSDDARRVGVLALVERGVSVWSAERRDAYDQPLGGVVVEIEDVADRETGEMSRFFTCLDPYGGGPVTVRRLAEAEVRQSGVEATAGSRITSLVKRLGAEIGDHKGSFLDPWIADRVRWMYTLVGVANLAA